MKSTKCFSPLLTAEVSIEQEQEKVANAIAAESQRYNDQ